MIEQFEKLIDFINSGERLFEALRHLMTIPIAFILYYLTDGTIQHEDLSTVRIFRFISEGEVLIPLLFYVIANIITFIVLPVFIKVIGALVGMWCIDGFIKKSFYKTNHHLRELRKNRKTPAFGKLSKWLRNFVFGKSLVHRERKSKEQMLQSIEIGSKLNIVMILFIISYWYFLSGKFVFLCKTDIFLQISMYVFLLNSLVNVRILLIAHKYLNVYNDNFSKR